MLNTRNQFVLSFHYTPRYAVYSMQVLAEKEERVKLIKVSLFAYISITYMSELFM